MKQTRKTSTKQQQTRRKNEFETTKNQALDITNKTHGILMRYHLLSR